ncbi:protein-glutamate O-methyltransferase CheR [Caproicibacterium argilliputei]|uniref:protein-glutamate O-methyltransferase n=1 Tax=Caproicibacterium argilliputei TaxID=3030016 RepID=A0AA97DB36_9FIRM|nr:protein-glutamate O-methyltransferase CheR [Caproicibacterium argilliputei]WOC33656.1 protein-glutamate O-methyltransferase CheR [Caproicibacterium argilliputei]
MVHLTDQEFHTLVEFVHSKYGINLSKKRVLIEGRLSQTLRQKGFTSFRQYIDLLKADRTGAEITAFLNRITTNHSYFARENEHFNYLANTVLPYMERTRNNRDLRIWSAGCSAGQEAYNMAMTIDQYFGPKKHLWDTTILATDISMNVLNRAKTAIYPENNLTNVPAIWKQKYFKPLGDGNYQVCDKIRKEVVFKPLNLMEPFHFIKPFDIIFCRNVMIYFDAPTTDRLIEKFYNVTAPGGYLFIGHSEVINKEVTKYHYVQPAIYQRGV